MGSQEGDIAIHSIRDGRVIAITVVWGGWGGVGGIVSEHGLLYCDRRYCVVTEYTFISFNGGNRIVVGLGGGRK